jgi:type IV pilus assembly protein PilC
MPVFRLTSVCKFLWIRCKTSDFRKTIAEVHNQVAGGESLSEAMSKAQDRCLTICLCTWSPLAKPAARWRWCLQRLAVYLEKADALKRKVKGAMIYPAVIAMCRNQRDNLFVD